MSAVTLHWKVIGKQFARFLCSCANLKCLHCIPKYTSNTWTYTCLFCAFYSHVGEKTWRLLNKWKQQWRQNQQRKMEIVVSNTTQNTGWTISLTFSWEFFTSTSILSANEHKQIRENRSLFGKRDFSLRHRLTWRTFDCMKINNFFHSPVRWRQCTLSLRFIFVLCTLLIWPLSRNKVC